MPRDAGVNDLRLPAVAPDIWETFVLVTRLQLSEKKQNVFGSCPEKSVAQRFCEAFEGAILSRPRKWAQQACAPTIHSRVFGQPLGRRGGSRSMQLRIGPASNLRT